MTANCESCGATILIVLDEDEEMEMRFVSTDSSGRAIYSIDIVPKEKRRKRNE